MTTKSCLPFKCEHSSGVSNFVTSCMHVTCKLCLKSHVESVVEISIKRSEPSYEAIRIQLQCPDQRCGAELKTTDIFNLLDIDTMNSYENWLRNAYRDLYGPISRANMLNCIECRQGNAIQSSRMSSNKGKGFNILKRSFAKSAKNNHSMDQLQIAKSKGSIQCPDSWVCTKCGFSWCPACGFAFGSEGGSNCSHSCSQANNYIINSIVADIELIYTEYTRGTMRENGFTFNCSWTYSAVKKIRKMEKELDRRAESVLKLLTSTLQNKTENQLQPILGFSSSVLLSRGNVVGQLLEYLVMNDSMLDICARSALYLQLVELLNTMLQYPELFKMLLGSETDVRNGFHDDGEFGSDSSVIKNLRNIYKQSKIVVNRVKDGNENINVQCELGIARSLLECYERLVSAAEKQASSTPSLNLVSENDDSKMIGDGTAAPDNTTLALAVKGPKSMENNDVSSDDCKNVFLYKESLKLLQFGEYPFIGAGSSVHTYSKYFDEAGSNPKRIDNTGVHNKKRMLHIAKEIASLATNLPLEWESSIHVRVDPVRMDLLKALIVGPKGTPYQNGIFIFDIYLPPDYPQLPPKVTFVTTGCGTVRFNPNLYFNGTVCLSLLGTYYGPGWQPWKSTLLQVLVSIQSLILVADPFYNEPGSVFSSRFRDLSGPAKEESRKHRYNTLKIAIIGALRQPDSSFKDVIVTHFQHKKDEIKSQCDEWIGLSSDDPTHSLHDELINTVNEVKRELDKLSPL
ncbi:hypothetical protein SUGI_0355200 [Cryptomeria japonica]|uniref:uncharacterized protein LOC131032897 isoform X2 n=1 Tax=Cryptomeria japonica TaxID=3369 RepID=UPI002408B95E|nr:uncharacterized protein LOC131032897 isoform X2 [Cryptomeria japonica]GLJ19624.1 hypothetical protein SUGI_0355200 [Cryptomeria japonica]